MATRPDPCPCGDLRGFAECCGAIHAGRRPAATAEELMRSRYSAFVVGDAGYLLASWAPEARPATLDLDPDQRWTGLDILATEGGRELAATGEVEFVAHYARDDRAGSLHERSRFRRHAGRWVYVDAVGTGS